MKTSVKADQKVIEALYSQRNIHLILHESIKYQLDKFLINWSLGAYFRIDTYLEGDYYASKNSRIKELKAHIAQEGLEDIIVAVLASVIRMHKDQTIQQCIGYLQSFMPHEDHFNRAKTAGELLSICGGPRRLYSIVRPNNQEAPIVKVNYWLSVEDVFGEQFNWVINTLFNPPLIEPPIKVSDNFNCGYHTLKEPLILGKLTHHTEHQDYASVNILNSIEWVLDQAVLAEPEQSPAPLLTPQDHQDFVSHLHQSQYIYNLLGAHPFWFAWQFDSRGRIYSHGYHVNFQSHEYKKAMLSFNKFEHLT